MKKLVITGLAVAGLALGAFAQGTININNAQASNGIADMTAGNYYGGTLGLEVWSLDGSTIPAGINGAANTDAYAALTAKGFHLDATLANKALDPGNPGVIQFGVQTLAGVAPHGSSAVLALAAWTGSAGSWSAAVATPGVHAGVLAMVTPVADPNPTTGTPGIPGTLDNVWTTDLVMTPVPEPTTFALAGLGAAALLIFRRRK